MTRQHWRTRLASTGLLGQVVAILLIALLIEFGVSTILYERASHFAVRDDEANRLAEHLVISRKLMSERPPAERPRMASELTTDRYVVRWEQSVPPPRRIAPALDEMRRQVIAWEPALTGAGLRLQLLSPGRSSVVTGGLQLDDGSWLGFRTLEPVGSLHFAFERVVLALVPAIALMVLAGVALRRSFRPLRRLAEAADQVGHGAVEPVREDGPGEVRRVIHAFNAMQERIRALIAGRTQALAAVGHDMRTPLARLHLRTESLPESDTRAAIQADVDEMEAMIASLLAFLSGDDPEQLSVVDVAVLCATVADDASDRGHAVTYAGPEHLDWRLRRLGIKRAVQNLVENALHYGSDVVMTLVSEDGALSIRVEDNGPGIPPEKLVVAREPFVRLDPARGRDTVGFGLGLAIVSQAATLEGGELILANRPQGGLCAEIRLPPPAATK